MTRSASSRAHDQRMIRAARKRRFQSGSRPDSGARSITDSFVMRAASYDARGSDLDPGPLLLLADRAVAVLLAEHPLADAVALRRDLEQLVVRQELDRVVERQVADTVELHRDVRVAAAHVREVLLPNDVHLEIAVADVLPHDHALVDVDAGSEEELPAALRLREPEGRRGAILPGDQRSEVPRVDVAGVRAVTREERVHHALAAGIREERLPEADQPARRDLVDAVRRAVVAILHVDQRAAPPP